MMREETFMQKAIALSQRGIVNNEGGPFGCVIVRDNEIVGEGSNMVTTLNDPTAHAEVVAIRDACKKLNTFQLDNCIIYSSCEPCPMCLGAIYWARPEKVIFANTRKEAAAIEFDDELIYSEINTSLESRKIPFIHVPHPKAKEIFEIWNKIEDKLKY